MASCADGIINDPSNIANDITQIQAIIALVPKVQSDCLNQSSIAA